jgi:hypothetical protein
VAEKYQRNGKEVFRRIYGSSGQYRAVSLAAHPLQGKQRVRGIFCTTAGWATNFCNVNNNGNANNNNASNATGGFAPIW